MADKQYHMVTWSKAWRGKYFAKCSCGWIGAEKDTQRQAEDDGDGHAIIMARMDQ